MAGLRRRRASSSEGSHWDAASWRAAAASGPTGLAEPLLAPNEAGGGVGAARGERERLFFAQLLRALVTGWRRLLEGVNGIVKGVSGVRGARGASVGASQKITQRRNSAEAQGEPKGCSFCARRQGAPWAAPRDVWRGVGCG